MMEKRTIKIIRPAPGYVVGRVYRDLEHGVRQTLVDCGRAVYVEDLSPPTIEPPAPPPPTPQPKFEPHRRKGQVK